MKRFVLCVMTLASVACGAFLADTGDDRAPDGQVPDDGASVDGATTDEGGSVAADGGDGSADANGGDSSAAIGATCGEAKCAPGSPCCVTSAEANCQVGEGPCSGSDLLCTRNLDCAPGEVCCITAADGIDPPISSAGCVAGGKCAAGSNVLCSPSDKTPGCPDTTTCTSGKLAVTLYGLPADPPWAVCE